MAIDCLDCFYSSFSYFFADKVHLVKVVSPHLRMFQYFFLKVFEEVWLDLSFYFLVFVFVTEAFCIDMSWDFVYYWLTINFLSLSSSFLEPIWFPQVARDTACFHPLLKVDLLEYFFSDFDQLNCIPQLKVFSYR